MAKQYTILIERRDTMLGKWRSHAEYQQYLIDALRMEKQRNPQSVTDFETSIQKLYRMNLDSVKDDFAGLFSYTGRPSNYQPEMFRAFILMCDQKEADIDKWIKTAKATPVFCAIVGVSPANFPGASTLRDFIKRLWAFEVPNRIVKAEPKPKHTYGNDKMPPKNPGIIQELVDKALEGYEFDDIPEIILQNIFNEVAIKPSIAESLIHNPQNVIISGDGTCIESHSSSRGKRVCSCQSECECGRSFADPCADWGWDSYHKRWFYGHTGYFFSTYNPELKLNLPLYLRFEKASAYDGTTFIKAFSHARVLWQGLLNIDSFVGDSAHDNLATYNLLISRKVKAFIDLNPKNDITDNNSSLTLSKNGVPVCADGYDMINWGFDKKRFRIKYRCPLALGRIKDCPYADNCNKTPYGKTVYIYMVESPRFLTPVPRGTDEWKLIYNRRTASERINNRILTDYQLERPKRYGKMKLAFFAFMNAVNVHLDARVKFGSPVSIALTV